LKANQALIDRLAAIGEKKGATPGQIALAWLLAQKPWIVPIPGTRKIERLDENLGATEVALTAADLSELAAALDEIEIVGERYPADLQKLTGR
jgi:aryl-alcohol dehydrogenase-like predicted oxidoreductase